MIFFNYHKNRLSRTLSEEGFGPLKITKQFKCHESGRLGRQLSFLVIFLIHMLFPRLGNIFNFLQSQTLILEEQFKFESSQETICLE